MKCLWWRSSIYWDALETLLISPQLIVYRLKSYWSCREFAMKFRHVLKFWGKFSIKWRPWIFQNSIWFKVYYSWVNFKRSYMYIRAFKGFLSLWWALRGFLFLTGPSKGFCLERILLRPFIYRRFFECFLCLSMEELFKDLQSIGLFLPYKNFKWSGEEKGKKSSFSMKNVLKDFGLQNISWPFEGYLIKEDHYWSFTLCK